MPAKFILDGYNVIHKIPYLAGFLSKSLQEAREALVRLIAEWRQPRGADVVIVFDRKKDALAGAPVRPSQKASGISCIFTAPGVEADDKIISLLMLEKNPANVMVVSADGKVINNAKALGVRAVPPSFLDKGPVRRQKRSSQGAEAKRLSPGRENDITQWYKKQLARKGV